MADVFAFKINKIIRRQAKRYAHNLLWALLAIGFAACQQNNNKQNVLPAAVNEDSLTLVNANKHLEREKNQDPPKEMVHELKKEAGYIVLVNITRVDSVYNAEKVFSAKVLKSFKGKLKPMDSLKYMVMSDLKYIEYPNDTLIVFLQKAKSTLSFSGSKDVFFYAMENASFTSTKYLDSLLTKK
ncbi:hypothetical protein [Pedobacter kyonggii]|uniref:Uncharacterized protein n=1 Tax=Pedobacter kyonggii TaxID=1926871 RepID=A0A4Q9HI96_9SPHI|nr:hypothetical protein [Pedobacter kyonggii]TBO45261.1 hypothetical protein EYS08_02670 [Pedobacter kyonggii]